MQKKSGRTFYSASDLANFLECEHLTTLDAVSYTHLGTILAKTKTISEALLQKCTLESNSKFGWDIISMHNSKSGNKEVHICLLYTSNLGIRRSATFIVRISSAFVPLSPKNQDANRTLNYHHAESMQLFWC